MRAITRRIRAALTSDALAARMRQVVSKQIAADAFDATKVTLNFIGASADAFPPLKSGVSAALGLIEMSERIKSNTSECEHLAKRAAQIVQDIWRQTKDFNVELPTAVEESVVDVETLFRNIEEFFNELENEKLWQRLAHQNRHKSQVEEYCRLLDEAMSRVDMNLQFSMRRLHEEHIAADEKRHDAVLSASQMSEAERLLLARIRAEIRIGGYAALGIIFFFGPDSGLW
ncbi:hypothetical protein C8F01DRAFT_1169234 [Mycena amicta]|nr:hypothetical protein C8F01DRAFT_1169234 [Mycena amicta]